MDIENEDHFSVLAEMWRAAWFSVCLLLSHAHVVVSKCIYITQLGTKVSHSNLTMAMCPLKTSKFSLIPDFVWVTVAFLAGDDISPLEIRPAIPAQIQAGCPFRSVRQVIHAQFDALHPAIETILGKQTPFSKMALYSSLPQKSQMPFSKNIGDQISMAERASLERRLPAARIWRKSPDSRDFKQHTVELDKSLKNR